MRIADGIPLYGVDIRERDLPQETEQMRALNFNKGCYVGQEIVERIRSRGNVHRKFTGFLIEGAGNVAAGDKIISGEKEVGEITSVGVVPTPIRRANCGLGLHSARSGSAGARGYDWCGESDRESIAFRRGSCGSCGASRYCNSGEKSINAEFAEVTRRTRRRICFRFESRI